MGSSIAHSILKGTVLFSLPMVTLRQDARYCGLQCLERKETASMPGKLEMTISQCLPNSILLSNSQASPRGFIYAENMKARTLVLTDGRGITVSYTLQTFKVWPSIYGADHSLKRLPKYLQCSLGKSS